MCLIRMVLIVFPMYVGVILKDLNRTADDGSVPHVCGGDPTTFQ